MGTGYRGCSKLRKSNPGFRGRSGPISRGKPYGRCLSLFAGNLCPRPSKEGTTFKFKMDEQNLTSTVLCAEFARQRHGYRGTSLMINSHLPWDYHTTLGIVVLWGPGGGDVSFDRGTPVPLQQVYPTGSWLLFTPQRYLAYKKRPPLAPRNRL